MKNANNVAIEVPGLAKRFGEVQAVAEVDFDVYPGELFGFLDEPTTGIDVSSANLSMNCTGAARPFS